MSSMSVLTLMLVLAHIAVVLSRPNDYYCSIPCPLTNPCESPGQNYPLTYRVLYEQNQSAACNAGTSMYNNMARTGPMTQEQAPPPPPPQAQPPRTEEKKKSGGLLSSLLNMPGAIADTILSGEITL